MVTTLTDEFVKHGELLSYEDSLENGRCDVAREKVPELQRERLQLEKSVDERFGEDAGQAMREHSNAMQDTWYGHIDRRGEAKAKALRKTWKIKWDGGLY